MRKLIVIALMIFSGAVFAAPPTSRALLIGIDKYQKTQATPAVFAARGAGSERAGWQNLDGCVNDAMSMRQLIISRFGFPESNIDTLFNDAATHDGILQSIDQLTAESNAGDVVLLYYAGHGSYVKNSRSYDGTKQDQTIVPSDLYDIRNKELSEKFNKLMDKGVVLTLIFDCCHSGSIARGNSLPMDYKSRQAPGVDFDANDPSEYPKVEERGALVFSAAQRDQTAKEARDENDIPHGAFTLALLKAINSTSSNESASRIFLRIVSTIKSDSGPKNQDPIMGGTEARKNATLFGQPVSDKKSSVVVGINKVEDGVVYLKGGYELSIYPGCRFAKPNGKDTLEVTFVGGIGVSQAKVVHGNGSSFAAGDIVEMVTWVTPDKPSLLIWKPACTLTQDQLNKQIAPVLALYTSGYYKKVEDPTAKAPQFVVQYNDGGWLVTEAGKAGNTKLAALNDANLKKAIPKSSEVYLQLPAPKELSDEMSKLIGKGTENSAVEFTNDPLKANYILAGRNANNAAEYALLRPNVSAGDSSFLNSLPLRTNWHALVPTAAAAADSLATYAVRLGKVNAWLNLTSPPDEFPYYLGLKRKGGAILKPGEVVHDGDRLELVLLLDTINFTSYPSQRYVYVFVMDNTGKMTLLYPGSALGEGNKVSYRSKFSSPRMIALEKKQGVPLGFTISEPFGYDTYFMVASETPLPTDVFNTEGVVTRGAGGSGLTSLLRNCGTRTRGVTADEVESPWSVQKIQVKSEPKAK